MSDDMRERPMPPHNLLIHCVGYVDRGCGACDWLRERGLIPCEREEIERCRHGEPESKCPACAACDACDGSCGVCPYSAPSCNAALDGDQP